MTCRGGMKRGCRALGRAGRTDSTDRQEVPKQDFAFQMLLPSGCHSLPPNRALSASVLLPWTAVILTLQSGNSLKGPDCRAPSDITWTPFRSCPSATDCPADLPCSISKSSPADENPSQIPELHALI